MPSPPPLRGVRSRARSGDEAIVTASAVGGTRDSEPRGGCRQTSTCRRSGFPPPETTRASRRGVEADTPYLGAIVDRQRHPQRVAHPAVTIASTM